MGAGPARQQDRAMPATPARILLVADKRREEPPIKRYRLARLRLEGPPVAVDRHAHLKRSYD